jgi:hypothetical protein
MMKSQLLTNYFLLFFYMCLLHISSAPVKIKTTHAIVHHPTVKSILPQARIPDCCGQAEERAGGDEEKADSGDVADSKSLRVRSTAEMCGPGHTSV